jgi:hypothetical protein
MEEIAFKSNRESLRRTMSLSNGAQNDMREDCHPERSERSQPPDSVPAGLEIHFCCFNFFVEDAPADTQVADYLEADPIFLLTLEVSKTKYIPLSKS